MSYSVYIILCDDKSFYTGYTENLKRRIKLHEAGKGARYTKMHKPKKLVYIEKFSSRKDAMRRERKIKRLSHHQKAQLIKSNAKTLRREKRST
jgi:putative endonuclease